MRKFFLLFKKLSILGLPLITIGIFFSNQVSGLLAQTTSEPVIWLPLIEKNPPVPAPSTTPTAIPPTILETFENSLSSWNIFADSSGGSSSVTRSSEQAAAGTFAARTATSNTDDVAQVRIDFSDPATNHTWAERVGTWHWQRASVYLPSTTVAQLGLNEYLTLAGMWPSATSGYGWFLRVRQNGELYVFGYTSDGKPVEFRVYGTIPQDQWVQLEIGLKTQAGPGVKRAFAFVVNGNFYGWYHQGRMVTETYNRAAIGILNTNSTDDLVVYVDQWYSMTNGSFPNGPDTRPTTNLQEHDYRNVNGTQWQIDWSTWEWDLRLDSQYGLYSSNYRLQSGRNIDRMPDLTSGWAEIEIDWPNGTPSLNPSGAFGPMVGFRKEINREENLEITLDALGNGQVNLIFEAWVNQNGSPVIMAQWPMPLASIGGTHIPEPGDIIRARWEQLDSTQLNVRGSYFDASAATWYTNIINTTFNATNVSGVNYVDGYHTAASVTIDSPQYSIRRFKVGTLATFP